MSKQGEGDDRFLTLRMEDLFDANHGYPGFLQILEIAGIEPPSASQLTNLLNQRINKTSRQSFPHWKDWTTPQLEELVSECGDLAEQYGYQVKQDIEEVLRNRSDHLRAPTAEHGDDGAEDR